MTTDVVCSSLGEWMVLMVFESLWNEGLCPSRVLEGRLPSNSPKPPCKNSHPERTVSLKSCLESFNHALQKTNPGVPLTAASKTAQARSLPAQRFHPRGNSARNSPASCPPSWRCAFVIPRLPVSYKALGISKREIGIQMPTKTRISCRVSCRWLLSLFVGTPKRRCESNSTWVGRTVGSSCPAASISPRLAQQ